MANDTVLALSRLARREQIRRTDRQVLTKAAGLLEAVAGATVSPGPRAGLSHLIAPVRPSDAIRAARTQAPDRDAQETCRALAETIRHALAEEQFTGRERELLAARTFFAAIAGLTLSRANEKGRSQDVSSAWPPPATLIS